MCGGNSFINNETPPPQYKPIAIRSHSSQVGQIQNKNKSWTSQKISSCIKPLTSIDFSFFGATTRTQVLSPKNKII
jgi:hypothetical protein